jgi:hypothetical protein
METRRNRLPLWAVLTIWLAVPVGLGVHYGILARQDASIAPRQRTATGMIHKITRGKHITAYYSFQYAGSSYQGSGSVSSKQCACEVTVYFDPVHPSTNTLVEYHRKAWADHLTMVICGYLAAALGVLLAAALAFKKRESRSEPEYSRIP